jgi:hypothetical protein
VKTVQKVILVAAVLVGAPLAWWAGWTLADNAAPPTHGSAEAGVGAGAIGAAVANGHRPGPTGGPPRLVSPTTPLPTVSPGPRPTQTAAPSATAPAPTDPPVTPTAVPSSESTDTPTSPEPTSPEPTATS